jgi:hypothetical protein
LTSKIKTKTQRAKTSRAGESGRRVLSQTRDAAEVPLTALSLPGFEIDNGPPIDYWGPRNVAKGGLSRPPLHVTRRSPGNELVTRTEKGKDGEPVMVLMPRVSIVDADKISDEAAAAVAEVSQTVNGALRVKLHDKHALGMFVGRVQIQERKQISAEPMSAEEWKRQYVREG